MFDGDEFRDQPFASARWTAPAPREQAGRDVDARLVLERGAAAELARDRAIEVEGHRRRAQDDRLKLAADRWRNQETTEAVVAWRSSAAPAGPVLYLRPELAAGGSNPWGRCGRLIGQSAAGWPRRADGLLFPASVRGRPDLNARVTVSPRADTRAIVRRAQRSSVDGRSWVSGVRLISWFHIHLR